MNSRRAVLAGGLAAPMLNLGAYRVFAASAQNPSPRTYSRRAVDLMRSSLVIDMLLNMAPLQQQLAASADPRPKTVDQSPLDEAQLDKLFSMGVDVCHPSRGATGYEQTLAFVARLNGYAAQYPERLRRIDTVADMDRLKAEKRIGYIVGVQNSEHFRTVDDVDQFYILGQRVSQLTYNRQNPIGAGSTERRDGGVTDFGAEVIGRMNALGMAVDVSHCGDRTTLDACELSRKPVLITHSNARALTAGHARCKSDEAIVAMAETGGVMGITGVRMFVRAEEPTTIEHVVDHIEYVARLAGVEHVGIGSDMDPDGYDDVSEPLRARLKASYKDSYGFRDKIDTDGFDHPRRLYDLTERLIARGWSDPDIALILGGNFRRALGAIWTGEKT